MKELNQKMIDHNIDVSNIKSNQEKLNAQFNTQVESLSLGAAGWHNLDDIQTLEGLEGNFFWSENPFNMSMIRFNFDAGMVGYKGTYHIQGIFPEEGIFYSVPNNPAVGYAFISLQPNGSGPVRCYIITGMMTDMNWKIMMLVLSKCGAAGPTFPCFAPIRVGM